jgi:hypothetical protein
MRESVSQEKSRTKKDVQVDRLRALELPPVRQSLFWSSGLAGTSLDVWERGGLGTNGDGTEDVP